MDPDAVIGCRNVDKHISNVFLGTNHLHAKWSTSIRSHPTKNLVLYPTNVIHGLSEIKRKKKLTFGHWPQLKQNFMLPFLHLVWQCQNVHFEKLRFQNAINKNVIFKNTIKHLVKSRSTFKIVVRPLKLPFPTIKNVNFYMFSNHHFFQTHLQTGHFSQFF